MINPLPKIALILEVECCQRSQGNFWRPSVNLNVIFLEVEGRQRRATVGDLPSPHSSGPKVLHLDLSNNNITDLLTLTSEADTRLLLKFNNLEKLDLSQNQLETVPNGLFQVRTI